MDTLVRRLITIIVEDDLFDAVLDPDHSDKPGSGRVSHVVKTTD